MVKIKCHRCRGEGTINLTGVYAKTMEMILAKPGTHAADLARNGGNCSPNAMNNRINYLVKVGLVRIEQYGRINNIFPVRPKKCQTKK